MHQNRKRHTLFYGWWVAGAALLISLYTGGVVFFGFTAVFEPIADELNWSYTQISFAASLRGLEMGLLAPVTGLLVDRWGPRKLMLGGIFIGGLGFIVLSRVNSLGVFYASFIMIAVGMSTCSGTVLITAVVNWFRRRVGIATGIAVSGFALGGLMVPLVTTLVDTFDWRTVMVIIGLGMWGIALPLSLLIRHKPEQYGYLPDGDTSSTAYIDEDMPTVRSEEVNIRAKDALKSSTFWHIALALMYHMLAVSAVVTHVMPYLSSVGVNRAMSSLVASTIPLVSIGGRLSFGGLGDRFDKRWLNAVCFALMALGLLLFGIVPGGGIWLLAPFIIIFSTGWGGSVTTRVNLLREYFGRHRFGTMHGFTVGVMMIGNITGAPLAGWIFDKWGSYQGAWFLLAGLASVAILIMVTTPPLRNGNPPD